MLFLGAAGVKPERSVETSGERRLARRREELLPKGGSADDERKPLERRYEAERTCKEA